MDVLRYMTFCRAVMANSQILLGLLSSSLPSTAIEDANMASTRVRTVTADNSDNDSSSSVVDAMYDDDDDV